MPRQRRLWGPLLLVIWSLPMLVVVGSQPGAEAEGSLQDRPAGAAEIWIEPRTGIEFVRIPGGCAPAGQSGAEHRELSRRIPPEMIQRLFGYEQPLREGCVEAFWLARHELTQGQYAALTGIRDQGCTKGPDHPASFLTWYEANDYAARLSALPEHVSAERVFRLPRESEWEYACRAGGTGAFAFGAIITPQQGNYKTHYAYGNAATAPPRGETAPVGSSAADAYGLKDMHGNVREWTLTDAGQLDGGSLRYGSPPDNARILKGGSYQDHPDALRCAARVVATPHWINCATGLRLLLERP